MQMELARSMAVELLREPIYLIVFYLAGNVRHLRLGRALCTAQISFGNSTTNPLNGDFAGYKFYKVILEAGPST